jgi:hypothetical protein
MMASCRMYASGRELWGGFSKNLYEGIGGTWVALLLVVVLHLAMFVVPYVALAQASFAPWLALPAAVGVGLNLATRSALAWRHRHSWQSVLLHPLAVLALLAIAVNSARWSARGRLWWAGRSYAARNDRLAT